MPRPGMARKFGINRPDPNTKPELSPGRDNCQTSSDASKVASAPAPAAAITAPTPKAPGKFLEHSRTVMLWLRDVGLGTSGYVLLVVVVTAGFAASFIALHQFGMQRMNYSDHQAWLVPVAIDGADIGLSVNALRAAMNGRSAFMARLMIVACTSISSGINYSHIPDYIGRRIAALLPILAVVLLESLMAEAREAHERRTGNVRPRLSLLRWVFGFKSTLAILRAYHLGIPLPDRMAVAAETVAAEKQVAKPRGRRGRGGKPKPAPKTPGGDNGQDNTGDQRAPVIDINLIRKYGEKSARAITVWLDSVKTGTPLSYRKVDELIVANGTAKLAIPRYIEDYGDPRKEAVDA